MSSSDEEYSGNTSCNSEDSEQARRASDSREERAQETFCTREFLVGVNALKHSYSPPLLAENQSTNDVQHEREKKILETSKDNLFTPGHYEVTSVVLDRLIMHGLPSFLTVLMLLGLPPNTTGNTT